MTPHHHVTRPLGRAAIALAAVGAVTLAGCSEGEVAEFDDAPEATQNTAPEGDRAEGSAETAEATADAAEHTAEPLVADAGLVHEDISQSPAVLDTLRPESGTVITPAGTLTVQEVEVIDSVPAEELGLAGDDGQGQGEAAAEGGEVEGEEATEGPGPDQVRAADGEEFRILTMSFTPDQATERWGDDAPQADASLALNLDGVQSHLHDLDGALDLRILFSVPQDGSGRLTISSEGHDQFVDVLTGEREEDEIAAGYYREVTTQDLNHTFPLDSDRVTLQHEHSEDRDGEGVVDYDLRVNSVGLTGWSAEQGWAAPDEMWLVVDWAYEVTADNDVYVATRTSDLDVTLTADLGGQTVEGNVKSAETRRSNSAEIVTVLAVPIDTVDLTLSLSGTTQFEAAGNYDVADEAQASLDFATDPLEVVFPDTRYGSAADEVEDAEDDGAEESDGDEAEETGDQDGR